MKTTLITLVALFSISAQAFAPSSSTATKTSVLYADTQEATKEATVSRPKVQQLGLLTFDLDDTLYPIAPCVEAANNAFVKAMEKFGFPGLSAFDIVETGKQVREEIAKTDPQKAAALTHTEIRELAIRREMQKIILERKLKSTAEDWATQVSSLSSVVRKHAENWANTAVSESVVQSVYTAWEMERHHAAERYIFPHVIESLKKIKEDHPNVVIGAITDGRANPLLMTFTLAPYFDFCMSWEDDQGGRQQFFKELDSVDGKGEELSWIYDAARHKYANLKHAQDSINSAQKNEKIKPLTWPATYDDLAWIHVGDDLAFDVGGSSACGAKTVLVTLPKSSGQEAPYRFDTSVKQPKWSTTTAKELETRIRMNELARPQVNVEINTLERLPIAIDEILRGEA
ncbi:unnamed protein product [Cylindrotheca closterium]|uniref:Uncharacterized protein n=1 Tax=Cylindrotheca closterium TaxID=2856 RepID=A0AAD2D035_9STRA|nr:unnamed protein product [Cylindrotheca closterium]